MPNLPLSVFATKIDGKSVLISMLKNKFLIYTCLLSTFSWGLFRPPITHILIGPDYHKLSCFQNQNQPNLSWVTQPPTTGLSLCWCCAADWVRIIVFTSLLTIYRVTMDVATAQLSPTLGWGALPSSPLPLKW
jgi:hypothetical protein